MIYGYLRVSTDKQSCENQERVIVEYLANKGTEVDLFIENTISATKNIKERRLDEVMEMLEKGDTLIVTEISRIGRSLGQIIYIVNELIAEGVNFIAIKENIHINGKQDIQTKVMVTMFGLFAEIERDLISKRTKEGLAVAKSKGKKIGRRAGSLSLKKTKLCGKEKRIAEFVAEGVSHREMARKLKVSRATLYNFCNNRGIPLG